MIFMKTIDCKARWPGNIPPKDFGQLALASIDFQTM